jgi:hypothetical protein
MQFKVTAIDLIFEGDSLITRDEINDINASYLNEVYEAEDEDDLIDFIIEDSGWPLRNIEFVNIVS